MQQYYRFENPPLPYSYKAMEPYIDIQTMYLHHDKHLQTYVDNLNKTLQDYTFLHNFTLEQLLENLASLPMEIRTAVKNNAGGVYSHILYFKELKNPAPSVPVGDLAKAIDKKFGSLEKLKKQFKEEALAVFGSGYAWLVADSKGDLQIVQTANQDTPLAKNLFPLMNVDVWEHAYYLKHHNLRTCYIDDWFQVLDWEFVSNRYQQHRM